jgi:large exoprotein involved in heme utilization and adhesion
LGFGSNPGSIQVQNQGHSLVSQPFSPIFRDFNSRGLQLKAGQTLALVGGELILDGGILNAEDGRIELGSVKKGTVSLNESSSGLVLGFESLPSFGNIQLLRKSLVDASGSGSNSIHIQGANVNLSDGSVILIQNQENQTAGSITVKASESLKIESTNPAFNQDFRFSGAIRNETIGSGKGGNLEILARDLVVRDGGAINTLSFSEADAGNLDIKATDSVRVIGIFPLDPTVNSNLSSAAFRSGAGGNVSIATEALRLETAGSVGTATVGTGQGGDVVINANSVEVVGKNPVLDIRSAITSNSFTAGKAGNLNVNVSQLFLDEGGAIVADTFGTGRAGTIEINASKLIQLNQNPSEIASSARVATGPLKELLGVPDFPSGSSGSILINTPNLRIGNGASISIQNEGTGNAERLQINSPSIFLGNTGSISATTASGQGGNILINSSNLRLNNSSITATAGGAGNGGNITINTDTLVGLNNSSITANAFKGRGGNIAIATRGIFFSPDSFITATSELGVDGTVQIEILQPVRQEPIAPTPKISTEQLLAASCFNRTEARGTFNFVGQSGLPLRPDSGFDSSGEAVKIPKPIAQEVSEGSPSVVASKRPWQIGDPVVEPDSIVKTPDGQVRFVNASVSQAPVSFEELICEPMQSQSGK